MGGKDWMLTLGDSELIKINWKKLLLFKGNRRIE